MSLKVEAEKLLKQKGFKIILNKLNGSVTTIVDGKEHFSASSAEFLLEKSKKRYVVHLHGGTLSADPTDPSLRRQFLESLLVYKPHGLLLLDMSDQSLHEIDFKFSNPRNLIDAIFQFIFIIFILAVILGIIWLLIYLKLF